MAMISRPSPRKAAEKAAPQPDAAERPDWLCRRRRPHFCRSFTASNDGQKGMGLIMLILIDVAPTAYW